MPQNVKKKEINLLAKNIRLNHMEPLKVVHASVL